ncbi:MAG: phytanoyl-CoA dioxygenase family protein, partial [Acidobacteriota bacterium]
MTIEVDGAEIHRRVFDRVELEALRQEADRVARRSESVCVRHLQQRSEIFDQLAKDSRVRALIPRGLQPVRSILFDKTPASNWPVPWHQDLTIAVDQKREVAGYGPWSVKDGVVHVQPPAALLEAMATVRIHLDDATTSSGALWVIPGSHRLGRISTDQIADFAEGDAIPCECRAGDVLVMSPLVLHSSRRTKDAQHRRVLHFEYAR